MTKELNRKTGIVFICREFIRYLYAAAAVRAGVTYRETI